jgi:peptide/nickel transport system substrate-binding protein
VKAKLLTTLGSTAGSNDPTDARRKFLVNSSGAATALSLSSYVSTSVAQDRRSETLIVANEFGPNMLDIHGLGANRPSYGVAWLVYDRLMTFGKKKMSDGNMSYDFNKLEPELAERWEIAKDGSGVTFFLRKNAQFHDGTPVTDKVLNGRLIER